ncbi:hypothetical protein KC614_05100 [candidate division WWE3 bacterium]|uniref:Uncharacterized protein n=1 Tax=candidate division WWE3 bacterium TaxID=2053526 RepID=A0A955LLN3_UNCKA|nr:hypothetical protein [candidate division WWE3 bacterium]
MALRELTLKDFDELRAFRDKWLDDAIQMYIAWRVHGKSYRQIASTYGISHELVGRKIKSLISQINNIQTGKLSVDKDGEK